MISRYRGAYRPASRVVVIAESGNACVEPRKLGGGALQRCDRELDLCGQIRRQVGAVAEQTEQFFWPQSPCSRATFRPGGPRALIPWWPCAMSDAEASLR